MNSVSKLVDFALFMPQQGCLDFLSNKIQAMALVDVGDNYRAIYQEYADDVNYLSFSVYTRPFESDPVVAIEFGVRSDVAKQAVGGFLGYWERRNKRITTLDTIVLRSYHCELHEFVRAFQDFLALPKVSEEISEELAEAE